jgi:hypothetical protein
MKPGDGRGWIAIMAAVLGLAALFSDRTNDESTETRLTPVSTAPGGGRAVATALDELGISVERLDRPWSDWVADDPQGTLVLIAPTAPTEAFEVERLAGWIERGGRLVLVPGNLRVGLGGVGRPDALLAERLGLSARTARRFGDGHRAERAPSLTPTARQALAGTPQQWSGWTRAFDVDSSHDAWVVDAAGRACVADCELGRGRVLLWSDPEGLRNDSAASGPWAAAFLRTVAVFADGSPVLLDGFSHGLGSLGSIPWALLRFLTRTDLGLALLLALAVGLVWLVTQTVRQAPPLPEPPPPGRSTVEHVEALAAAYARAGARARPARLLIQQAERRLGKIDLGQRLERLDRTRPELGASTERVRAALGAPRSVTVDELARLALDLDAVTAAQYPDRRVP